MTVPLAREEYQDQAVAADLLPAPWPGAPTCACCTPDPARRPALERLRTQRDSLVVARRAHRLMPLGEYFSRRWTA